MMKWWCHWFWNPIAIIKFGQSNEAATPEHGDRPQVEWRSYGRPWMILAWLLYITKNSTSRQTRHIKLVFNASMRTFAETYGLIAWFTSEIPAEVARLLIFRLITRIRAHRVKMICTSDSSENGAMSNMIVTTADASSRTFAVSSINDAPWSKPSINLSNLMAVHDYQKTQPARYQKLCMSVLFIRQRL